MIGRLGRPAVLGGSAVLCAGIYNSYSDPNSLAHDRLDSVLRVGRTALWSTVIAADYKLWHMKMERQGVQRGDVEWAESQAEVNRRSAQRLLHICQANGGVYTKWGQYIASMNHVLPPQYAEELSVLQDKVPPRPWDEIKERVEAELGGSIESHFSSFSTAPIASASLAQVHRATTLDGKDVAVKVQYPKLDRQVEGDIWTMRMFAKAVDTLFPSLGFSWMLPEFEGNIRRELDFNNEADNAETITKMLEHRKDLYIPRVERMLTSHRVLTMEFVEGAKVTELDRLADMGIDSLAVAEAVSSAFGEMTFCHGFIHCDPHPGNLLVRQTADGSPQLVILDHGMYRQLQPSFRAAYCRLWQALIMRDHDLLTNSAKELGIEKYAEMLPYLFSFRSAARKAQLGKGATKPDAKVLGRRFTVAELNTFLASLPRDMLFVLRTLDLARSVNMTLGGDSRQRFRINAACAIKGLSLDDPAAAASLESSNAAVPMSRRKKLANAIRRRLGLAEVQLRVWFIDMVFGWIWWWNTARG